MKQSVLRFAAQLWAMLAVLLLFVAAALPAHPLYRNSGHPRRWLRRYHL